MNRWVTVSDESMSYEAKYLPIHLNQGARLVELGTERAKETTMTNKFENDNWTHRQTTKRNARAVSLFTI